MDATTGSPDLPLTPEVDGEAAMSVAPVAAPTVPVAAAAAPVVPVVPVAPVAAACPCQITFSGMLASEAPKVEVRAWLQRLGALTAPMTGGRVLIEAIDQDRKERQYQVRLEISMPGEVVVVGPDHPSNGPHEDVYVAIRNAFRGARRQLELHRLGPNGSTDLSI
jgi:hypothetical protein